MKIAHLLLSNPSCSAEWVKRIMSLLAGGYDLQGYALQVALLYNQDEYASSIIPSIRVVVDHYIETTSQLHDNGIESWFCHSTVERLQAKTIQGLISELSKDYILNDTWLSSENELQVWMKALDALCLGLSSGDCLILPVRIDNDARDLKLVEAVLAYYPVEVIKDSVTVICELGDNNISSSISRAFQLIQNKCKLVVVGRRHDTYNKAFTYLQTGSAILDAITHDIDGEPVFLEPKTGMKYLPNNLSSLASLQSLQRMSLIDNVLNDDASHGSLKQWYSNLHLNRDDLWKSKPFISILNIFQDMRAWIRESSSEFELDSSVDKLNAALQKMNSIAPMSLKLIQSERRKTAAISLLSCDADTVFASGCEVKYSSLSRDILDFIDLDFSLEHHPIELSPTFVFELTDLSFSEKYQSNQGAKFLRSACLDLWEIFFLYPKDQILGVLNVSESKLSVMNNSMLNKLLTLTSVGERMMLEDRFYRITSSLGTGFEAYTSPLTGFCVIKPGNLVLNDVQYFYQSRELKERTKEVHRFIYTYVQMHANHFSSEFKDYISRQTDKKLRAEFEARGCDIIRLYPKFRNHVGIDIV